ncbi:MAG: IS5 family transposase [Actinomycetota bacterium]|nr:IS5 family transposase [Rubrobacter sp.]MDQ3428417.1 IS5 family transposase [Actinomycetota bacterium]
MAKELVTDELWEVIEPLLPQEPPKPRGGRPRVDDRAVLTGILFVLKSGIPWEMLPQEMGCGSGMTCWRRLEEWHEAGVWEKLHRKLLDRLGKADEIDWERASLDSSSVAAPGGGKKTGKNPTDKGKQGSKRHVMVDRKGVPLAVMHTAANVHDSKALEETVDAVSPIRKPGRGRPRKRPKKLHADKGYDFPRCRESLRKRGITPRIARRGIESSERLGRYRWVVERTLSWLNRYRRLKVRYERRDDIHQAFLDLGCALICWRYVQRLC